MRREDTPRDFRGNQLDGQSQAEDRPVAAEPSRDLRRPFTATPTEFTAKRVELILQQLDALPTLGVVAMRVLELTADSDTQTRDVVSLVASDPSLSSKVIKLCRCSEHGRGFDVTTVDRAVKVLGFDALRSAVLSVQVFEVLDDSDPVSGHEERRDDAQAFDRAAFWQHSLAVGYICESFAGSVGQCRNIPKSEAFLAGLLHDLGTLALHVILPRTFDRICRFADSNGVSLDQSCRSMIGLDTHTAGRRLSEHWRLPHALGDVLWLHGQRMDSIPNLSHKPMVALVTLADILARSQGMAPAGHGSRGEDTMELLAYLELSESDLVRTMQSLHESVMQRSDAIGLRQPLDREGLLKSVSRANLALGRLNASMRQRALLANRQTQTLRAITQFHDSAAPGGSVVNLMGKVVESAASVFGGGFFAMLYQARLNDPWQLIQFSTDGRPMRSELISPPPGSTAVADLADNTQVSMQVMGMLPWLCDYLGDSRDLRDVQLLPLRCGWGVNAVLLHDCPVDGQEVREQLEALGRTWAAAIAAGAQHEGAKRLGEQLAESNRALIDTQDELGRTQALAALGEIAAGAAHEMNNPLTVISGRSQLLAATLTDPSAKSMAEQIRDQSHRISDMITALRTFAEPTKPQTRPVNLAQLLDAVIREVSGRYDDSKWTGEIKVVVEQGLADAHIDPEQIGRALSELLRNAIESESCTHVVVRVQIDPMNDRLMISVTDNGSGLTPHALTHAFDPFFSCKPAGRQPGLGLAQARRLVEAHGGQVTLENNKSPSARGAVATIRLNQWRGTVMQQRGAA